MKDEITLMLAGDFYPGKVTEVLTENLNPFSEIPGLDFSIINLEGPLTFRKKPIPKSGPNLRIDPKWSSILSSVGFTAFSLANNHIMDMGSEGLLDTLSTCEKAHIQCFGAGRNLHEARKPIILEKYGIKIGILAFAEQEFSIAKEDTPGANPLEIIQNHYDIKKLSSIVDKMVVIIHGGNEYYPYPRPSLVELCRFYVESGANAVICHHSHIVNGFEEYHGAPIFYGLGNYFFSGSSIDNDGFHTGFAVTLRLSPTHNVEFAILPYLFDDKGVHSLEGVKREGFFEEITIKSKVIQDPKALTNEWNHFCIKKQNYYLSHLLFRTRIGRFLYRKGILKIWMITKRMNVIYDFLNCESHREAILNGLNQSVFSGKNPKTIKSSR